MDIFNFNFLHRIQGRLLGRVQTLQASFANRLSAITNPTSLRLRRRLLGFCLLLSAVILGVWANEIAKSEALLAWEKSHVPSKQIFGFAMGSRGLQEVKELRRLQQASRALPSSLDENGTMWISEDSNWIAYYLTNEGLAEAKLYCLDCLDIPKKWHPVGLGWKGLELTLVALDKKIAATKKMPRPTKTASPYRDPREIQY